MSTSYTTLLGLALPVQGELAGQWGNEVNNYITNYLDASVAGTQTLSTDADVTLTKTTGTSLGATSSQYAILNCTGARTALRTITAPAASKIYIVINATTGGYSVKLVGAGPTTGLTIPNGASATVAWNGSDFVEIGSGTIGNLTVNGNLSVTGTSTLTGNVTYSAGTANQVQFLNASKVLSGSSSLTWDGTYLTAGSIKDSALTSGRVTYAGASGLLQDSSSLTFDGTTLTAGGLATGGSVTLSGGTANGVLYLNGSKVATSGSVLTYDGTNNLTVPREIYRDSDTSYIRLAGGNPASTGATVLMFGSTHATNPNRLSLTAAGSTATSYIDFSAGGSEQMRLTSTGLGIGTSSPGVKLDTVGVVRGTFNSQSNGGSTQHGLELRQSTTSTKALVAGYSTAGTQTGAYIQAVNFGTAYEDLVLQPQGGNLGLGVTPSAWGSPFRAQQIGTGGSFIAGRTDGVSQVQVGANAYYNGTNWIYVNSSVLASRYYQNGGTHVWDTAPSGTAGNAITFTQAMTLSAAGGLSVGLTTDAGAGNLLANGAYLKQAVSLGSNASPSSEVGFQYQYSSSANRSGLYFHNTYSNNGAAWMSFWTSDTSNNYAERARIDSSGNLLVGTTTTSGGKATFSAVANYNDLATGDSLVLSNSAGTGSNSNPINIGVIQFGNPAVTNGNIGRLAVVQENPGDSTAGSMRFYTNGGGGNTQTLERARITSGGDLLVGTTDAAQTSGAGFKVGGGGSGGGGVGQVAVVDADSTNTTVTYRLYSTGASAYRFYVGLGGTIYATSTTITGISDVRLKENIRDLDAGLPEVMALKPRKFDWKPGKGKDKKNDRGWIAQEFEQVFPDMVDTWQDPAPEGEEPYKAVNADLIPVLVKAIQEQQALITALTARVAQLESK